MAGVLSSITDCLVGGAKAIFVHHISYLIYVGKTVKDLSGTMSAVNAKKDDILGRAELAEREPKKPTRQVEDWLAKVQLIDGEAAAIIKEYEKRSCICVGGCSLNCWSNYRIGRRAAKKLEEAKELVAAVPSDEHITMAVLPPPAQEIPAATPSPVSAGLLQSNVDKALSFLRDDDKVATVMGIWGMGGVGKTTLLVEINNCLACRDHHSNLFDVVIFVTASRGCTLEMLQGQIVKNLKLGETAGDATSTTIYKFLSNKNFLVLLDDLWEYLDLSKAGIPHPLGMLNNQKKRRKVILTTRSEDVCAKMGAISRRRIKVECLNQADALQLFRENVTEEVIGSHPDIPPLAEKVAEECQGLPLALITIGRAMSNMTSPQEWNTALSSLQKSRLIPGMDDDQIKLFTLLKHSYNHLQDDRMRECFLYCSLWPEDYVIENDELIELWMGHGLLEDTNYKFSVHRSIEEIYDLGYSIIRRLKAACLLESVEYWKAVKMHDVLRDMASWIVETDKGETWVSSIGVQPEVRWNEANKAFLYYFDLSTQPSVAGTISPISPKLSTLILKDCKLGGRREFFTDIQVFSELKYLELSWCKMSFFPVEYICGQLKLEYLDLSYTGIPSLPEELSRLRNLKYLILRDTEITALPQGLLSNLEKLRVLDLLSGPDVALDSPSIEQIAAAAHGGRRISIGVNVSALSDVQRLTQSGTPIRSLHMVGLELGSDSLHLLSPGLLGSDGPIRSTLKQLRISDCEGLHHLMIVVEDESQSHHNRHDRLMSSTALSLSQSLERLALEDMSNLKDIIWEGVSPAELFRNLGVIQIFHCFGLKHVTWVLHLPCLQRLTLCECSSMRHVIDLDQVAVAVPADEKSSNQQTGAPAAFPRLRNLYFDVLPALVSICNSDHFTFPSLEMITVLSCPMLKRLPSQLPNTSTKLKEIRGVKAWWDGLEDDSIRSSLRPFYREW